jgi:threonine/homoserine/homoserine lactone efflux protein
MDLTGMGTAWSAAFLTTNFLLNITPGPAVMQVVGHSMANGWRPAQASILGILTANGMYCAFAALGLGALILALPQLFDAVKWAGMAYLAWLGLRALGNAFGSRPIETTASGHARPAELFRQSFLLQGANPKSVFFFCALLPTFAGSAVGAPARIALLGAVALVLEYPVLLAYALLAARARVVVTGGFGRRALDFLSGCVLLGAVSRVAATSAQRR